MPLAPGSRLGSYEVVSALGSGGMGEVYQARDPRLGRDVALKVLPQEVAVDRERLARFEREARVLASLNHPNIATLHGFERAGEVRFLVMELVPGETLAERLAPGPLPVAEALPLFLQVAEGLEAAHEAGVVHRDLKPANVKVTPDGRVKLLDFGLAKAVAAAAEPGDASRSPTLTSLATQRGEIMGTAAYMSPEQARGRPVDRRADIWAFGCVLFEALAGRRPFTGETITDLLAAIVKEEPDWTALPGAVPAPVAELLRRCLEKDARQRLRDVGDARLEISRALGRTTATISGRLRPEAGEIDVSGRAAPAARGRRWAAVAGLGVALLAGAALGASILRWVAPGGPSGGAGGVARVLVEAPPGIVAGSPRITPDGRTVVYYGWPKDQAGVGGLEARLYARPLEAWESRPIEGTGGAIAATISPDGKWLAAAARVAPGSSKRRIIKVPLDGNAPPLTLADWSDAWADNVIWLPDGDLLVAATDPAALVRIHTDGSGASEPRALSAGIAPGGLRLRSALPDGRVLATVASWEGGGFHDRIVLVDPGTAAVAALLDDGSQPQWSPSGHLLFTRRDTLLAAPFDPAEGAPGPPVAIARGARLERFDAGAWFDFSPAGVLVYQPGGHASARRCLVTVDREGKVTPWSEDRLPFVASPALSSDGRRLAVTVMGDDWLFTIWASEIDRPRLSLVAAQPQMDCDSPVWHPDGEHLLYACVGREERAGVYLAPANGSGARRILRADAGALFVNPVSISPDGTWLIFERRLGDAGSLHLLRIAPDAAEQPQSAGKPLLAADPGATDARFSPDGRWITYVSQAAGRREIHVRPFAPGGEIGPPALVAAGPEGGPAWVGRDRDDGQVLAYPAGGGRVAAVTIRGGPVASVSEPRPFLDLSQVEPPLSGGASLPDGRFLSMQLAEEELGTGKVLVVLDWLHELERLAPLPR